MARSLSVKQILFAKYLLRQLGFNDELKIQEYLHNLIKVSGRWSTNQNNKWTFDYDETITTLLEEIDIRKNKSSIKIRKENITTINATDLGNYIFCPISYSISKSFYIEKYNNEDLIIYGKYLHEEFSLFSKLIGNIKNQDHKYETIGFEHLFKNNEILTKISESELIFSGHKENENEAFYNPVENWKGAPDFIFKDKNGEYFVVEEKFHKGYKYEDGIYDATEEKPVIFFKNHITQLISYIKNIIEYKINYGYLIYWEYLIEYNDSYPFVNKVNIRKVNLDSKSENLYAFGKNGILDLQSRKNTAFDRNKLNLKKCVSCVLTKYCNHKTGRFSRIEIPYKVADLNLFITKFPEELKKKNPNVA